MSGFPEWSPEQRIVEKRVLEKIEESFRLHGFINIETCGVESYERLVKKGDGKEIYRLSKAGSGEENLGLHFDLTLPLARYVLERKGDLVFPFRRFQIQKVWRGEDAACLATCDGLGAEGTSASSDFSGAFIFAPFSWEEDIPLIIEWRSECRPPVYPEAFLEPDLRPRLYKCALNI